MRRPMTLLVAMSLIMVLGCSNPLAEVEPATVTQILISHPDGGIGITDQSQITTLLTAMRNAKADSTVYETAKLLSIEIQRGKTSLPRIPAGGPLFNVGKQQYCSEKFENIVRGFLTKKRPSN